MVNATSPDSSGWTAAGAVPANIKARIEALGRENASPDAYMAAFMSIITSLKGTPRTGWVDRDVPNPEHIGDHMYRMAVICMMTNDKSLNIGKCIEIALCHDMAECLVGDITPYDDKVTSEEKHRRELEAMEYLRDLVAKFNPAAAERIFESWCAYENQTNAEARFVKDVDKLELMYQADEYQSKHPAIDLSEFQSVGKLVKSEEGKGWAAGLREYSDLPSN